MWPDVWAEQLSHAPVVVYVDNNSAMDVAISGAAKPKTANDLLEVLLGVEMQAGVTAWYQRVPSPSNIAESMGYARLLPTYTYNCLAIGKPRRVL